jgi:hypothetical protein
MSSTHRSLPHNHLPAAANSTGGSHSTTPLNPLSTGWVHSGVDGSIISFQELHPPCALKREAPLRVGRIPTRSQLSCSKSNTIIPFHTCACC